MYVTYHSDYVFQYNASVSRECLWSCNHRADDSGFLGAVTLRGRAFSIALGFKF